MEPTCIKNAKVSIPDTTLLPDEDIALSDNNEWVTDADGNVFDKNGKLVGYTMEAIVYALDQQLSEAYGVDFHKVTRMREAGLLKEKDVTNELLLSPEFKYVPNPALVSKPWLEPDDNEEVDEELEREIKRATEEAIAEMVAEDDWEDEPKNGYVKSKA